MRVLKQFRYVMYFDGVSNYVRVPNSPLLNIQSGNQISIIIFANILGWQSGYSVGIIIDKRTEGQANYNWEYDNLEMRMRVHANNSLWIVRVPHNLGVWNHYTMVLNGSWLGGYLNGTLKAYRSDVPPTQSNTQDLFIGTSISRLYNIWGYIAQVLIYSRALSDSEIQWNYQNHDKPIRNGLVLWLQADPAYVKDIDGDGIPEWIDLSGYGNHGKIYGAQLVQLIKTPARVLKPVRILKPLR
jgi:hypothetical protein